MLNKGNLVPEETVRKCLEGAGKGLYALHEAKIFHRSICPQHILIDAEGNVKIMLLGLTRFIKQCTSHPFKTKLVVSYDPPEVFQGGAFRKAADMWALGCTIYELCTLGVILLITM